MDVGLGLPLTVPGVEAAAILDWARAGDRAVFSTLATLDRLAYHNYDSLTTLAAAAAVTERCRLATAILLAPLHTNTALLAKQVATIDRISGGRVVLGLSIGSRPDDFAASGVGPKGRGPRLERQLDELRRIWAGAHQGPSALIGPGPAQQGGPPFILGGHAPAALDRAARYGQGWIAGAGPLGMFRAGAAAFRSAWERHGREGAPRVLALGYFSLGADARQHAEAYVRDYYGFAPPYAEMVLNGAAVGERRTEELLTGYEQAGCDELILMPCSADVQQVEFLRAVVQGLTLAGAGAGHGEEAR